MNNSTQQAGNLSGDESEPAARRKFWKDGETVIVRSFGRECRVFVFAGLFAFFGSGRGAYYSKVENELVWLDEEDAVCQAQSEGLPLVYFNPTRWTADPYLTLQCQDAHRTFVERNPGKVPAVVYADA